MGTIITFYSYKGGTGRSMALAKRHLQTASSGAFDSALDAETEAILTCMETEDWEEGLRAFAEKRDPDFKGS